MHACSEQFFRREFLSACERARREGLDTYSLRRTFASLCELAGLPPSRWHTYHGHGPRTVADLYLQTNDRTVSAPVIIWALAVPTVRR